MTAERNAGTDLSAFTFLPPGIDTIIESHTLPNVRLGKALYQLVTDRINLPSEQGGFDGNASFGVHNIDGELAGTTPFLQFLVDEMLQPYGARTALPLDLGDKKILRAVENKHWVDARTLVLRGTNRKYEKNTPLFNALAERVSDLSVPVMISGLHVVAWPQDKKGYGLQVVPADDFTVTPDDRFDAKWNGYIFTNTDERGLPADLKKSGNGRVWYTSDQHLSGLCLSGDLDLNSNIEYLALSGPGGRVVIVSRGASAPNFSRILDVQAKNELLKDLETVGKTATDLYAKLKAKE